MKIDFSAILKGADDQPLLIQIAPGEFSPAKLSVIVGAALNRVDAQRPDNLETAIRKGNLIIQISRGSEQEISPEEASMMRAALPAVWPPLIVARAAALLQ